MRDIKNISSATLFLRAVHLREVSKILEPLNVQNKKTELVNIQTIIFVHFCLRRDEKNIIVDLIIKVSRLELQKKILLKLK